MSEGMNTRPHNYQRSSVLESAIKMLTSTSYLREYINNLIIILLLGPRLCRLSTCEMQYFLQGVYVHTNTITCSDNPMLLVVSWGRI